MSGVTVEERLQVLESEIIVLRNMVNLNSANINQQAATNNEHHLRQATMGVKVDTLETDVALLKSYHPSQ